MGKILKLANFRKTIYYLKKNGIRSAFYAARERIDSEKEDSYCYQGLTEEERERQRKEGENFSVRFSILVPVYETREDLLRAMIGSVLAQTYGNFELILADASKSEEPEKIIASYQDKRILYKKIRQNGGISANTNQALMYATGDYAALLDHDDLLTEDALFAMAERIEQAQREDTELQMLYSDEDKCDGDATHYFEPHRKENFNLDLILSNNYICHFLVMKRQLMQELQLNGACDGAQDFDLVLRTVNHMMGKNRQAVKAEKLPIVHVDRVLYHWRCHRDSTAENPASKAYAYDAGKRAVEGFLRLRGWKGKVVSLKHLGFYRVEYEPDLLSNRPDVGLVGGRLIDHKNKIAGGIYKEDGTPLYAGLHKEYSGYMHRAVLQQEAEVIDVRCMMASPEGEKLIEELTGLPYMKNPVNKRFDWQGSLKEDVDYLELSRKLCSQIRQKGMRIVYDPAMTEKI